MKLNLIRSFRIVVTPFLVTVFAMSPAFSSQLGTPVKGDICQAFEAKKAREASLKARQEYYRVYDQIVYMCGQPWFDRFMFKIGRFSNAAVGTFAFKFSQDEEEKRKRLMSERLAEIERETGRPVDARVREQLNTELGFFERIPTFDVKERWDHQGFSTTVADILNFPDLDKALDQCYPITPKSKSYLDWLATKSQNRWMKYYFRMALAYDDVAPTVAGVVAGGAATYFLGGAAVKGVQASRAALVARGVNPTTLRYAKYVGLLALGGGAYYGWHSMHQTTAEIEKIETSLEDKVVENITTPESSVLAAKDECFQIIEMNKKPGVNPLANTLTRLTCDYFTQLANQTLMTLENVPQYRCQKNYAERVQVIESALKAYTSLIDQTQ